LPSIALRRPLKRGHLSFRVVNHIDCRAVCADNEHVDAPGVEKKGMNAQTRTTGTDPRAQADAEAVLRHALHGEPLDPEVSRRVHERAARVTEEVFRLHGEIDTETISALFRDDDET
jgi:hypothetical protein